MDAMNNAPRLAQVIDNPLLLQNQTHVSSKETKKIGKISFEIGA
jgi:hypothetical protein